MTTIDEAVKNIDGALMRSKIFDPNTPDYAFLTYEEVCAAFDCTYRTIRNWQRLNDFPIAVLYPGGDGYPVILLREFLAKRANIGRKQRLSRS